MYDGNHISPSSLAMNEVCPKFKSNGKESEAATEGTLLHEMLEQIVQLPESNWDNWIETRQLSETNKGFLQEAAQQIRMLAPLGKLKVVPGYVIEKEDTVVEDGMYPECQVQIARGRRGFIDLLVVSHGIATVVDYKSVRAEHDYTLQLGSYCLALSRLTKNLSVFEAKVVAPRLQESPAPIIFGEEELKSLASRIDTIEENAEDPSISPNPCEYCAYCRWNGRCKQQAESVKALGPADTSVSRVTVSALLHPSTPEERALRRDAVAFLSAFIESVKDDDKAFIMDQHGDIPGYTVSICKGKTSIDGAKMSEIYDAFKGRYGLSDSDLLGLTKIDEKAVVPFLSVRLGLSEKRAKTEFDLTVEPYTKQGLPYPVVRKSGTTRRLVTAVKQLEQ